MFDWRHATSIFCGGFSVSWKSNPATKSPMMSSGPAGR
ncbi:hypothetical protein HNP47_003219 [Brevundimonas vesicularis]|uniref:Uncharacterized protein n=1 Tax=Brevundimonas vesicularis TaxID=41276 RepID=A0A7W9FX36_BREVE|nr:hypothetical protein [Brevundimonas vesicularis]